MERMRGVAVTKIMGKLGQRERDFIGTEIMRLCFREIKQFRFMQTDPNWTNFLWNAEDQMVGFDTYSRLFGMGNAILTPRRRPPSTRSSS
jgi:predicted unusual protein kinase regulating ubiquinone biosynthesis (AarF/ABC1/UbiB family)